MKCIRCGGNAYKSTANEAIDTDFGLLIIRNIPCYKCEECDEILYTGDVAEKIEEIIDSVNRSVQDITVVDYLKVA